MNVGAFIEMLERWATLLRGDVGSRSNPFITNAITGFGGSIVNLLIWILVIMITVTSALDIMYISFPMYRMLFGTLEGKIMAKFGTGKNGTGGQRLAKTTRNVAARKADSEGVALGLLYYLKSRALFYIFFGTFVSIFFTHHGIAKIVHYAGTTIRNMYVTAAEATYVEDSGGNSRISYSNNGEDSMMAGSQKDEQGRQYVDYNGTRYYADMTGAVYYEDANGTHHYVEQTLPELTVLAGRSGVGIGDPSGGN